MDLMPIITAVITGGITLVGIMISNGSKQAVLEEKISELSDRMNKHNNLIERTYELEKRVAVTEERIKVANNRIDDLEKGN